MPTPTASQRRSLEDYVQAIEAAFTRQRGRPFRVLGLDFALARRLHAEGLPVDVLLDEWRLACRQGPDVGTLTFLEARLLARARSFQARAVTDETASPMADDPVQAWLVALKARRVAAPSLPAVLIPVVDDIVALLEAGTDADGRARVRALVEQLEQLALAHAGDDAQRRYRERACSALERQRGRLAPEALATALARYERRCACEDLGLPLPS
jgi:hypothetical protein